MSGRLLVVECEGATSECRAALVGAGYRVLVVDAAPTAGRVVGELTPDVVVLDAGRAWRDALELCRELAAVCAGRTGLLLVGPAEEFAAWYLHALEAGADCCLPASVGPAAVSAQVRALLRRQSSGVPEGTRVQRESEQGRLALEIAQLGTFELDPTSHVVRFDERCQEVLGLDAEPVPFGRVLALVDEADRERVRLGMEAALDPPGSGLHDTECCLRRADGTTRHVHLRGRTIWEESASARRPAGFFGTLMDVTAQRQAEEASRANEERLRLAIDTTELGAFDFDPQGGRLVWSDYAKRHFGLGPTAAVSYDTFLRGLHPGDRPRMEALIAHVLRPESGGEYATEYRTVGIEDGVERWLSARGRVFFDAQGRPTRFIGVTLDITPQKQAEQTLHAAMDAAEEGRRTLHAIMEHIPLGITVADAPDVRIRAVSRFGRELTGRPPEEIEGIPVDLHADRWKVFRADGVTPASNDELPLTRATLRGEVVRQEVWVLGHADGRRFPILCTEAPILDADGRIQGGVIGWQDITERRRAEDALQRANEDLREASRRKDEFIAILSHELRNPLAPIRFALPLLDREGLSDPGMRGVRVIERQVNLLTRLVDDLLDVSRISTGKLELRPQRVALASVVTAALEAAAPLIQSARHEVTTAVPEPPVWVLGDLARLTQVVTNLINNSARCTPRGGRIRVEVGCENGWAFVSVQDNGIGIPPEALPALFEMFRQVDRLDKPQGGLGIGLALSKRLVELHGGTIQAHSAGAGQGATFTVRLPVAQEEPPAAAAGPDAADIVRGRLKVLIVDDNEDLVEMLGMVVSNLGHEVRKALDGGSALAAALSYAPDIVLLDIGLPVLSGLEVARELRRRPEMSHVRLVAITGWGQPEDRARTRQAGFDHHLTKPIDPERLLALLKQPA